MIPEVGRHLVFHGSVALIVPVVSVVLLRGLDGGTIMLFVVPPLLAALFTRKELPQTTRRIAWAFLAAVGIGAGVARLPWLFPKLGGFDAKLAPMHDRMLTWYCMVYLVWIVTVLPIHIFYGNLHAHSQGRPMRFSRFICFLGLFTSGIMTLSLPAILSILGFWPVF